MTLEQPQLCPVVSPHCYNEEKQPPIVFGAGKMEIQVSIMRTIKEKGAGRMKFALAVGVAMVSLMGAQAAQAYQAYVTAPAPILTGPSADYPPVVYLRGGEPVEVYGCLDGYEWCDIQFREFRGWFDADQLTYAYEGRRVPLYDYGYDIGLPIINFSLGDYWGRYYRDRPFYRQRERFEHIPMPRPREDHRRFEGGPGFDRDHGFQGRPDFNRDRGQQARPEFDRGQGRPDFDRDRGQQGRPDFNRGQQFDQQRAQQEQQRAGQEQQRVMEQQRMQQQQQMQQRGGQDQQRMQEQQRFQEQQQRAGQDAQRAMVQQRMQQEQQRMQQQPRPQPPMQAPQPQMQAPQPPRPQPAPQAAPAPAGPPPAHLDSSRPGGGRGDRGRDHDQDNK
jgi:uncharacterized protein YraI